MSAECVAAAAAVVFVPAAAVVAAGPEVAGCIGPSEPAGC